MFNRIAVAVDYSEPSRAALAKVTELAAPGAEVLVVHARTVAGARTAYIPESPSEATDLVNGVVAGLRARGLRARGQISRSLEGRQAHAIADAAEGFQADVILAGTRGRSHLAGLFLGSVSQKLMQVSRQPVLLVRAGAGSEAIAA